MLRVAAIVGLLVVSSANAQVIFAPVQYQFGSDSKYYYGGNDPAVHARAQHNGRVALLWDRAHGQGLTERAWQYTPTYSDDIRHVDTRYFHFGANDASNEANANSPLYFRKADLLRSAIPLADGSWVVPANLKPGPRFYVLPAPASRPVSAKPLLIIPKEHLEQKLAPTKEFAQNR